jgi:hypothetical protein
MGYSAAADSTAFGLGSCRISSNAVTAANQVPAPKSRFAEISEEFLSDADDVPHFLSTIQTAGLRWIELSGLLPHIVDATHLWKPSRRVIILTRGDRVDAHRELTDGARPMKRGISLSVPRLPHEECEPFFPSFSD